MVTLLFDLCGFLAGITFGLFVEWFRILGCGVRVLGLILCPGVCTL